MVKVKVLKKAIAVISVILIIFSFCSCGKAETKPSEDKTIPEDTAKDVIGYSLPVIKTDSLNPYEAASDANLSFSTLLYDSLFTVDNTYKPEKQIASDFSQTSDRITVKIKENLSFSDGSKLTAADVVYSFNLAKKCESYAYDLRNISSASVSGDYTVVFALIHSKKGQEAGLVFPVIKQGSETKADINNDTLNFPIGSGRYYYCIEDSVKMLKINKSRLGGYNAEYSRIGLRIVKDAKSLENLMYVGSLDFYVTTFADGKYKSYSGEYEKIPMNNFVYLGINSDNKLLSSSKIRMALSLMMDRSEFVSVSYAGFGEVTSTPFPPSYYLLNGNTLPTVECKSSAGSEIIRNILKADDISPNLTLIVNNENAFKTALAHNISQTFAHCGLNVVVNELTYQSYLERVEEGSYDLYIGECKMPHSLDLSQFFYSGGTLSHGISVSSPSSVAYKKYANGEISLQNFIDTFSDDLPFIPISYRQGYTVKGKKLSVNPVSGIADYYCNINEWNVSDE